MIVIVALVIFVVSVLAMGYSYLLYPLLLKVLSLHKVSPKNNSDKIYTRQDRLPFVLILIAAYNEADVIADKLHSIVKTNYPTDRYMCWVGSDASDDGTDNIVDSFAKAYPQIKLFSFEGRSGKIKIINALVQEWHNQLAVPEKTVLVMTDANVMFNKHTLFELVRYFKDSKIGVVAAKVLNILPKKKRSSYSGIHREERWYIARENTIKYYEGLLNGGMMGAFGACFAIRAQCFTPVPNNFMVDDFFLTLKTIEKGKWAIENPEAICYEDVSNSIHEEFRRKKRIAVGNFQNLRHFAHLLNPFNSRVAFNFFSHKVLRWWGPFFILMALISSGIIAFATQNLIFLCLFLLQLAALISPIWVAYLENLGFKNAFLSFLHYFYAMNIALGIGFIYYLKGKKEAVWQPTNRS